ncbi:GQ67_00728T0 [Komagataella phaffii]|nr:GQ67_00728T0 [Komagataella phaffii]AOA68072.1 GQ68_00661T0 [Komagataella phaffii GS115]
MYTYTAYTSCINESNMHGCIMSRSNIIPSVVHSSFNETDLFTTSKLTMDDKSRSSLSNILCQLSSIGTQSLSESESEVKLNEGSKRPLNISPTSPSQHLTNSKRKRVAINSTYNPHSREKLLSRIETYGILNWTVEDSTLTPLKCGLYGWRCRTGDKNMLECVSCHHRLSIQLNEFHSSVDNEFSEDVGTSIGYGNLIFQFDEEEDTDYEKFMILRQSLVDRYLSMMCKTVLENGSHKKYCPWTVKHSSLSDYHISMNDIGYFLGRLVKNVNVLRDNKKFWSNKSFIHGLNNKDLKILVSWNKTQRFNNKLTNTSGYDDIKSIIVSLFSWELSKQRFQNRTVCLLRCNQCFRRILLGSFDEQLLRSRDSHFQPGKLEDELNLTPSKVLTPVPYISDYTDSIYDENESDVDLINDHHTWCSIISNSSSTAELGYRTILRMMDSITHYNVQDDDGDDVVADLSDNLTRETEDMVISGTSMNDIMSISPNTKYDDWKETKSVTESLRRLRDLGHAI